MTHSSPLFLRSFFQRWARCAACLATSVALLAAWVPTAHAESLVAADAKAVREVIEAQLTAFAKDDAVKAFSFAAPNIRKSFGTAINFMSMVRSGYPVVYRPASVTFLKTEGQDRQALQRVQMNDANGGAWLATYTLTKQKNNTWRITGCVLADNKGGVA